VGVMTAPTGVPGSRQFVFGQPGTGSTNRASMTSGPVQVARQIQIAVLAHLHLERRTVIHNKSIEGRNCRKALGDARGSAFCVSLMPL